MDCDSMQQVFPDGLTCSPCHYQISSKMYKSFSVLILLYMFLCDMIHFPLAVLLPVFQIKTCMFFGKCLLERMCHDPPNLPCILWSYYKSTNHDTKMVILMNFIWLFQCRCIKKIINYFMAKYNFWKNWQNNHPSLLCCVTIVTIKCCNFNIIFVCELCLFINTVHVFK